MVWWTSSPCVMDFPPSPHADSACAYAASLLAACGGQFTPLLAQFYKKAKEQGRPFEVVFARYVEGALSDAAGTEQACR